MEVSTLEQVSWQSAFWSLPSLALSSMTQPTEQVLQYPPLLRTHLRISPIVCGVDALARIVRFFAYLVTGDFTSPTRAAARAMRIQPQAQNINQHGSNIGLQALESITSIRWLIFCVGTLPQAIKLMALGGLPWTKAWGVLYLGSFLITECLLAMGKRAPIVQAPVLNQTPPLSSQVRLEASLQRFEVFCGELAIISQLIVLGWMYNELIYHPSECINPFEHDVSYPRYPIYLVAAPGIFAYICYLISAAVYKRISSPIQLMLSFGSAAGMVFETALMIYLNYLNSMEGTEPTIAVLEVCCRGIISASFIAVSILLFGLGKLLARNGWIRYKVLLVDPQNERDHWPIAAYSIFVSTLVVTLCYYGFRYDPTGTYKPPWTNNLG